MSTNLEKPIVTYATVVGKALQQLRKERDFGQEEMSIALSISQSAYSRLESGNSVFSIIQLRIAAQALGIPLSQLMLKVEKIEDEMSANNVEIVNEKPLNPASVLLGMGILLAILASNK